ncbi:MAG: AgmX/PglI C-terminal domain-containing protein [Polyangiales bacterium]
MRFALLSSLLLLATSVNAQDSRGGDFDLRFEQEQSPVNQRRLDDAKSEVEACLQSRGVWSFVYSNVRGRRGLTLAEGNEISQDLIQCVRYALSSLRLRRGESMRIVARRRHRSLRSFVHSPASIATNSWDVETPPDPPPGRLEVQTLTAEGPLTPAEVAAVVEPAMQPMKACYEHVLSEFPRLAGALEFRFVVSADGRVTEVRFPNPTRFEHIVLCLRHAIVGLRFEPRAANTNVRYSVVFSRQ